MITDMTFVMLVLMFLALAAALERGNRRNGSLSPLPFDGEALACENRDLARIRQELGAADGGRRLA